MVTALMAGGWDVRLVGTPSARDWVDGDAVGVSPRFDFRSPEHPRPPGDPDVVAVCPATFNTINKVAAGFADNYATALVCEALGMRRRVVVAPMVNHKLWGHPALSSSFAALRDLGVEFLDVQTGEAGLSAVRSGSGDLVVSAFQPSWLAAAVQSLGPARHGPR